MDQWRWSLNWDDITDNIVVGACPRSPGDVDRLVEEAKVDAIICLQSDGCFDALKIDWQAIRERGLERGVMMTRVAVWDFNHADQALMLPEAVRMLAVLVAMGKRVYVHCTAGINRATLTVVGYLTFVQGWDLQDAVQFVKKKRPQAHPYIDCWKTVRARLTEGRTEEIIATATRLYEDRAASGEDGSSSGDDFADWLEAEKIIIRETFQRQITAHLSLLSAIKDMEKLREDEAVCMPFQEFESMQAEMGLLRGKLAEERSSLRTAQLKLDRTNEQVRLLRQHKPDAVALLEDREAREQRLRLAESEISSLKSAIREVAMSAYKAMRTKEGGKEAAPAGSGASAATAGALPAGSSPNAPVAEPREPSA